ncbi:unnamed protein product [Mycena citricolor]|uniref:Zn(2)-C6 fungal-type domain-containing protein n=1 Tax=Mycena citricolor TaxID=2018698 RepID=A0AAD2HLA6_9AGAR|nr:unnamed protein product [Mycena citricolor]
MTPSPMPSDSSSSSPSPNASGGKTKQRRVTRSCDACRSRKIRCDGTQDGTCAHCSSFGLTCTYALPAQKRGPKDKTLEELRAQVSALEAKLEALSSASTRCRKCGWTSSEDSPEADGSSSSSASSSVGTPKSALDPVSLSAEVDDDEDELVTRFSRFFVDKIKVHCNFGTASTFALANTLLVEKEDATGATRTTARRPETWDPFPWEEGPTPQFTFPPDNTILSLMDLYWERVHPLMPILHRPTFERSIRENAHRRDVGFGQVLLAALANASRFAEDSSVFLDGCLPLSAGHKFIHQTMDMHRTHLEPTLHSAQYFALMAGFVKGYSRPFMAWYYLGLAMRVLQGRQSLKQKRVVGQFDYECEMWNRMFWCCFTTEATICAYVGRRPILRIEDYDMAPPLEVDDEFWGPDLYQPHNKLAISSYLVYNCSLCEILYNAHQRLYASKKTQIKNGWNTAEAECQSMAELDSAMNAWFSSVPAHLRWDSEIAQSDPVLFNQSALLFMSYHYVMMIIHRPYRNANRSTAVPSTEICLGSARAILKACVKWQPTLKTTAPYEFLNPIFVAALVLTSKVLRVKAAGHARQTEKDSQLVQNGMDVLQFAESRWAMAGRFVDMLQELRELRPPEQQPMVTLAPGVTIEQLLGELPTSEYLWPRFGANETNNLMNLWTAPMDIACVSLVLCARFSNDRDLERMGLSSGMHFWARAMNGWRLTRIRFSYEFRCLY